VAFFIGSAAVCGLPPLNGFIGELLIYGAAWVGVIQSPEPLLASFLVIGSLALIGGLALACFVKIFGIAFLGEPRSDQAAQVREVPWPMYVPMGVMSMLCIGIGLLNPLALGVVARGAFDLLPFSPAEIRLEGWNLLWIGHRLSILFFGLYGAGLLLLLFRWFLLSRRALEQRGTWDCGYAVPTARMQYSGSSLIWPILECFRVLVRPRIQGEDVRNLFPKGARIETQTDDLVMKGIYVPFFHMVERFAARLRFIQEGRNQLYVLYLALTILTLLIWKLGFSA